jgi:hypothetical protein
MTVNEILKLLDRVEAEIEALLVASNMPDEEAKHEFGAVYSSIGLLRDVVKKVGRRLKEYMSIAGVDRAQTFKSPTGGGGVIFNENAWARLVKGLDRPAVEALVKLLEYAGYSVQTAGSVGGLKTSYGRPAPEKPVLGHP